MELVYFSDSNYHIRFLIIIFSRSKGKHFTYQRIFKCQKKEKPIKVLV